MAYRDKEAITDTQFRARMRQEGFKDGRGNLSKRYDHPEYLRSYRRGKEAREAEENATD